MNIISFDFDLITIEKSFEKRPERAVDSEIQKFKEFIKDKKVRWTEEEKIELEMDNFDANEVLRNISVHFSEMTHQLIDGELKDYMDEGYTIIGFDESSTTFSGTYARLAGFKFGEAQLQLKDGRYDEKIYMYKPIHAYIEDNEHKLIIYRDVIEDFVNIIKAKFYNSGMQNEIDRLEMWYKSTYKTKIESHINSHAFYYPSIGHVVDRIRTADEILKSLIRIAELSEWGKRKDIIFLGDGIQMFRQHIFPPQAFVDFFYAFLKTYDIKYYSFSKTCRLRDAQGNFILPIWAEILKNECFMVEVPSLSKYTKSNTYLVRMDENSEALRFDVPEFYSFTQAKKALRNLIPYSPRGYPKCLNKAHKGSTLLVSEYNKLETKFLELKFNTHTKDYTQSWREKVLGD